MKFFIVMALIIIGANGFAANKENGQKIYTAKCVQCHGENGQGVVAEEGPMLAGQFDWYISSQLTAFKKGERKNPKMMPFLQGLTTKDFEDLAAYISSLRLN